MSSQGRSRIVLHRLITPLLDALRWAEPFEYGEDDEELPAAATAGGRPAA